MRPRKTNPRPSDAELDILSILWKTGPATVRSVHEQIEKTKPSRYTTTLKLMQIMAAKNLLQRDESERSHVYKPTVAREHHERHLVGDLMERVFTGSLRRLVLGALGGRRATRDELDELRAVIREQEKGGAERNVGKGRTR